MKMDKIFLLELSKELRQFDLSLNFKKTEIKELPVASVEQWVRKINSTLIIQKNEKIDFIIIRAYLDLAIELMKNNKDNSAILNYAIKVLSNEIPRQTQKIIILKQYFI